MVHHLCKLLKEFAIVKISLSLPYNTVHHIHGIQRI